jgi:AraC-like DNA-binding protein
MKSKHLTKNSAQAKRALIRARQAGAVAKHCAASMAKSAPIGLAQASRRPILREHYCNSHFRALHHRYTGESVVARLRRYRLDHALAQLLTTSVEVKRVADAAGYGSQAAFTRAFTKHFGVAPAALRARGGPSTPFAKPVALGLAFKAFCSSQHQIRNM